MKRRRWVADPLAHLRAITMSKPMEEITPDLVDAHLKHFAEYERLKTGAGTVQDFDHLLRDMKLVAVLAYQIDQGLGKTITAGIYAMGRVKTRYLEKKIIALDGPGISEVANALDVMSSVINKSSANQIVAASKICDWSGYKNA